MADGALNITRDQLAQALGGNMRAVRLLESLLLNVRDTLPAAINEVQLSTLFSLHGADGSKGASNHASALAMELQTILTACQRQSSELATMRSEIDMLRQELHSAQARLSSAVARAQSDASQALTATIGV